MVSHNDAAVYCLRCNLCTMLMLEDCKAQQMYMTAYATKKGPSLAAQLQYFQAAVQKKKKMFEAEEAAAPDLLDIKNM
jgi:hypothetical protein